MPSDMEILNELKQIEASMPRLKAVAKDYATAYREACKPLKPLQDKFKAAKAAVAAAKTRMSELLAIGGE